jgi:uncharacterized secreted repeat protein (TIGR03808 family)
MGLRDLPCRRLSHPGTALLAHNLNGFAARNRVSPMDIDRRRLVALTAIAGMAATSEAAAAPPSLTALGVLATQLGVQPGSPEDQSLTLQRAIDQVAVARVPLVLPPGVYRVGDLKLRSGCRLVGIRGATRLVLTGGPSLLSASQVDHVALSGLTLDGAARPLPEGRGLIHVAVGREVRIDDCEITASGGNGIVLEQVEGAVTGNTVSTTSGAAIFCRDARGLTIARNTVRGAANNGILVWRQEAGDDGTLVLDNRIEDIAARAGGSGQNGNAINIFRAHNVVVRGNRIRGAAFSAVRGNAASNLQIIANSCSGLGEVALYAEFGFEGAVIANNTVDGAALGVSVTNFNEGGRLAVVQGNLIRNLMPKRPAGTDPSDGSGIGIGVEADAAVTGNVIENAPTAGIQIGWGQYLRDVAVTGNVVRRAGIGIAVSVAPGAGSALIADNLIAGTTRGAILGMEWSKPVTGDLAAESTRFAQLSISGNRVR